jgi:transcriptional antiterminator RfaH
MLRREEWPEQRTEPLFPCYLFVHFNPSKVSAAPIRNTKGVLGLVRFGDVIPAVPKEVIEQLQQLAPSGLWIVPKDLFDIHERVRITHGALANVIARIGEHDKGQRKLLLYEVLGSANRVSVPRELLTRA